MEHHATFQAKTLLEHGPRLRALARQLVGEERADDLVQDAWLRAVERGGDGTRWSWLGRVLRNLAFDRRRTDAARAERERAVARPEAGSDEGARFAMHRELVAAIDRLEAPYRQAIVLRYFDALPPRRIAARLGVPVKTVKTRLHRGLALLREELDRRNGGREAWLAAMVPLATAAPRAGALDGGSALLRVGPALELALAAAAVSAGIYVALPTKGGAKPAGTAELVATVEEPVEAAASELATQGTRASSSAREATPVVAAPPAARPPGPALAVASGARHGRVLDADGNALAGVQVGFQPAEREPDVIVLSGADGGFELPDVHRRVQSRDARFATVLGSWIDPERVAADEEHVIVVAPSVRLGGTVRNRQGELLANVSVRMDVPLSFRGRFREALAHSWQRGSVGTDEEGRFLLAGWPGLACATIVAESGHTRGEGVAAPTADALDLELVLDLAEPSAQGPDALHVVGEVRHADGSLAPGAFVALGGVSTHADATALFELHVPPPSTRGGMTLSDGSGRVLGRVGGEPEPPRELVAVLPGEIAARLGPERDADGHELWPTFATLWLGGAARSISGQVIGTDGLPLVGAIVWSDDLSMVDERREGFLTLEHLMAGKTEEPQDRWLCARSMADGSFELTALLERDYVLAVMDPATLQIVRSGPIAAGSTDVQLVLPASGVFERLAGRVLDSHGAPCAGVSLELLRQTFGLPGGFVGREYRSAGLTDEEGRFELVRVARAGVELRFSDRSFFPVHLQLESITDPRDVRVEALRLGPVQISVTGAAPEGASIELRDAANQSVLFRIIGGSHNTTLRSLVLSDALRFANGRTPVLSVPDTARAAVLLDAQKNELRRVTVTVGAELAEVTL